MIAVIRLLGVGAMSVYLSACGGKDAVADSQFDNLCLERDTMQALMLEEINAARSQARYCGDVYFDAADALTWSQRLELMAHNHSTDMAENNFFSHEGTDSTLASRAQDVDYPYANLSENIAAGQQSVGTVMQGWLNSPGHCSNIMNVQVTEVGASCVLSDTARYSTYWTQNFGRQR